MDSTNKTIVHIDEYHILWFVMNRPDKRNAIDYDVMEQLNGAIQLAKTNDSIRGFVITGTGDKAFCSGGDLTVFHRLKTKEEAFSMLSKMGNILYELLTLPIPTFALLNGTAVGGGCEIASACDIRIALHNNVKIGFVQGNLGITTGWGGATMLMEKLQPADALTLLYSGKIYNVEMAKHLHFIQSMQPLSTRQQQSEYIDSQLVQSANVLRSYKSALIKKWMFSKVQERMAEEINNCAMLWAQDGHHEAVQSFLNK